jgi:hypothetical protein
MIDMETVKAISDAGGVVHRRGREWLAGSRSLSRSNVGRLYRANMLTGRRGGPTYTLTTVAYKALRALHARTPAVGTRLAFRNTGYNPSKTHRYLEGRVVAQVSTRLIVSVGDALYELERRGSDGRWKGSRTMPGRWRGTPTWDSVQRFLPVGWFKPLEARIHTLARLREVRRRLESIGACAGESPEEQAAMNYADPVMPYLRRNVEDARGPVADYLRAVIANDASEVDAAERATILEDVRHYLWPGRRRIYDDKDVIVPTLEETCDKMRGWPRDVIAWAYAQAQPPAQAAANDLNEYRRECRERRKR